MQTVKTFSGSLTPKKSTSKFNWADVKPGVIHKAVVGTDYTSHKGFCISMTRYANETNHTVERYIAPDGEFVEFRLTQNPTPIVDDGV